MSRLIDSIQDAADGAVVGVPAKHSQIEYTLAFLTRGSKEAI